MIERLLVRVFVLDDTERLAWRIVGRVPVDRFPELPLALSEEALIVAVAELRAPKALRPGTNIPS